MLKEQIKELLHKTKMPLSEIASKSGVNLRTLHNWLNSDIGLTVYNAENVLRVLGYKVEVKEL
jgi:transcriptional regulator with XRE-family HTH domain